MKIPELTELLTRERKLYLARRKSARALCKFWATGYVKPVASEGRPAGHYFLIDGKEYLATFVGFSTYEIRLTPLMVGPVIIKEF